MGGDITHFNYFYAFLAHAIQKPNENNKLFNLLGPLIGEHRVSGQRTFVPKLFLLYLGGCVLWYNIKYNKIVLVLNFF